MKPRIPMRKALEDPNLLGHALPGPTWRPWRVLLIALMGESLTDDERVIFRELTGRDHEAGFRCEEFIAIIGRRGGKSRAMAALVAYVTGLCDHPELVLGERGMALIIASDQEQALTCLSYVEAAFMGSPLLRQLIESKTQKQIRLTNKLLIMVRASDYRRVRGVTLLLAIADEAAFWTSTADSANPDSEIIGALRPALATCGGLLCLISSPHAKRGELWNLYKRYYGPAGDPHVLVAKAPSRTMNPSLPESVVRRAIERDAVAAASEYGVEFRSDVANFIDREVVMAAVMPNVREIMPAAGTSYMAFCDPSGGSANSFTIAIGHTRGDVVVIDCVREIPAPFSPEIATAELALVLKSYRVSKVTGDRYAGEWPREAFMRHGISYELAPAPKSTLYLTALPLLNSGRIELVDNRRLIAQICNLERRTARGGRDSVDHPAGSAHHDDLANAALGLVSLCFNVASVGWSAEIWAAVVGDIPPLDRSTEEIERARRVHPASYGPNAPGAVDLGNGGYKAANYWNPSTEAADRAWEEFRRTYGKGGAS